MKYILLLCIGALLVGCSPSEVQLQQARFACKDKGGLFETYYEIRLGAICNNGEYIKQVTDIKITDPEFYSKENTKDE